MRVIALGLLVSVAGCERATPEEAGTMRIEIDTAGGEASGNAAAPAAADFGNAPATASIGVGLPGGIDAKVTIPSAILADGNVSIGGVGLYPGARIGPFDLAQERSDGLVTIGFTAPAAPTLVADWYERQFAAQGRPVLRNGLTLRGITADNTAFTLLITPEGNGARGLMTVRDTPNG